MPAMIKPKLKYLSYSLNGIQNYNEELYHNIINTSSLLTSHKIVDLGPFLSFSSVLINVLMGKTALAKNWHILYFNPGKNKKTNYYSLIPDLKNVPYGPISAPIRRFPDKFNEQILYHYLNDNMNFELWNKYLTFLHEKNPQIVTYHQYLRK